MDTTFIQWLVGQTGVTGLAGFALWMLKNVYDDKLKREREMNITLQELNNTLTETIRDNTVALTSLKEAIANLRAK